MLGLVTVETETEEPKVRVLVVEPLDSVVVERPEKEESEDMLVVEEAVEDD